MLNSLRRRPKTNDAHLGFVFAPLSLPGYAAHGAVLWQAIRTAFFCSSTRDASSDRMKSGEIGMSANAVMTQVWVAFCLYLILAFIRFISKTVHSMYEIFNWIRIHLFSNEILDDYLVPRMTEPVVKPQLALF
ncbi:MAG: hypothetical protein IJ165_11070 [Proteobacteria bacterium]|nr:hypothetical protein [Pseudomonadota bacterium]